ncbi:MAG: hypothetical protein ACK53W_12510 [Gemmatimonadota bacterium]|jgi:hypothetical protein
MSATAARAIPTRAAYRPVITTECNMTENSAGISAGQQRLVRLARALDEFERGDGPVAEVAISINMNSIVKTSAHCGTTCCAIGLAALHPAFPELMWVQIGQGGCVRLNGLTTHWSGQELAAYWGIGQQQAWWLFGPMSYVPTGTPGNAEDLGAWVARHINGRHVIERIRVLLKEAGIDLDAELARLA